MDDPRDRLPLLGLPEDLSGLTVLDVGAWDGFFSFECERRGAERVVAADWFAWHEAARGSKESFELAREALGSSVEDVEIRVEELSPERVGTFDLVLFAGVLYHVRDPLRALEAVASVTKGHCCSRRTSTSSCGASPPPPSIPHSSWAATTRTGGARTRPRWRACCARSASRTW